MKKGILFITILSVLIFTLAACAAGPAASSSQAAPSASTSAVSASTTPAASAATGTAAVSIENFSFKPATLTIKAGTTVLWTNNDTASHNIKSDTFSSPMIAPGANAGIKFDKPGTYDYYCGIHPNMKGTIIVQ